MHNIFWVIWYHTTLSLSRYEEYNLKTLDDEVQIPAQAPSWWGYFLCGVKGVIQELEVTKCQGVQVLVSGVIPPSAGLSSSSALVVSAALVTVWSNRVNIAREELASLCARYSLVSVNHKSTI